MKKQDGLYFKAKRDKLRSRAYYKIEEFDAKFKLLKGNKKIIDLGCSPGSWLEYLDKNMKNGEIFGVDLLPVENQWQFTNKIHIFQMDFLSDAFKEAFSNIHFDLVLSDMAPEFSGNKNLDFHRTYNLNMNTIEFAKLFLKKNKNLIFKTFQGKDLDDVLAEAKKIFGTVKLFKPKSSSRTSAETFVICLGKL